MPVSDANQVVEEIRTVRQARQYYPDPVTDADLNSLLEVARWTGSSRNTQPWHFVVVKDKTALKTLSEARAAINWLADVPVAIALVMNGANPDSEGYDEGRVTERILIAAKLLGYGGGTAWFLDENEQRIARTTLAIPDDKAIRSVVGIGKPITTKDHRPNANIPGRKPATEVISYEHYGQS